MHVDQRVRRSWSLNSLGIGGRKKTARVECVHISFCFKQFRLRVHRLALQSSPSVELLATGGEIL